MTPTTAEVIFWLASAVIALVLFVFYVIKQPDDTECIHAFPIIDKNIDDMEDKWD